METSSFDTIGSAYFARTSFCQVFGWKKLLIITNKFHMSRTRAVFDWLFDVPNKDGGSTPRYELYYLECPNTGLNPEVLTARLEKEATGLKNVNKLKMRYRTLVDVLVFLTSKHSMYSVSSNDLVHLPGKILGKSVSPSSSDVSVLIKQSYEVVTQESSESDIQNGKEGKPPLHMTTE